MRRKRAIAALILAALFGAAAGALNAPTWVGVVGLVVYVPVVTPWIFNVWEDR